MRNRFVRVSLCAMLGVGSFVLGTAPQAAATSCTAISGPPKPTNGDMSCAFVATAPAVTAICTDIPPTSENCHIYIINVQSQTLECVFDGPKPLIGVCLVAPGKVYQCYARWANKAPPIPTTKMLMCVN